MIRLIVSLSILFTSYMGFASSSDTFTTIEDQVNLSIQTPSFAGRETLKLRLHNGLEAILISDPQIDLSSAALVVRTGSWDDPEEHTGTAHFLEHMLFLGTKKYPQESEYSHFINEHGGVYNAFTSNDATSYMFTVNHNAFPEALDRFVNFFIEPLFNPSGVSRELNAIDQEYAKNVENDGIRQYYILKALTNPAHPNHAFGMGNYDALVNVSQETLKEWYKQHYSSNIMRLIVTSPLPIGELKKLVVTDFSEIPNRNLQPLDSKTAMFSKENLGHMVYIEPIKQLRSLTLFWELPSSFADMRDSRPERLLSYVIGHEGKESLLADLRREKLANELSSGSHIIGGHNMIFYIDIELSDLGVKKINDVINEVFEALANIKEKGVPHYLYNESQQIAKLNYEYQVRQDTFHQAISDAKSLAHEDISTYPKETLFINKFDPEAISALVNYLTPEHCIFNLVAPEKLTGVKTTLEEPWLGVHYQVESIPTETLNEWKQAKPNSRINLPELNPFIPTKLSLVHDSSLNETKGSSLKLPQPAMIINDELGNVYFAQDFIYGLPKIAWSFEIRTPMIRGDSAESLVLGDLYVRTMLAILCPQAYAASLAGMSLQMSRTDNGIFIGIEGYSEKANNFFLKIIKSLKDPSIKEQQFKTFKELLSRQYQNAAFEQPLSQAGELLSSILFKDYVSEQKMAAAIKKITFTQFEKFVEALFNQVFIEGMMYGNMTDIQAKEVSKELVSVLEGKPYPAAEHYKRTLLDLPEGGPFFLDAKTKSQGNATILTIASEPFSFKTRAAQQILMLSMKEPFFSALRTKQQTGYLVSNKTEEIEKHIFDTFIVQSNTHDGRDLLSRFELFIEDFMQEITKEGVPEERFNTIKHSILTNMLQPPKDMGAMSALLSKLAFHYDADFDWISKRIQGLEELSYIEFLENAQQTMSKRNKARLAILLNGAIPEPYILQYKKIPNSRKQPEGNK